MGRSNKSVHHIIGIMAVPDKVLAAEEHLDRRMLQFSL